MRAFSKTTPEPCSRVCSGAVHQEGIAEIRGSRSLIFGLGILGGGVATTNWLLEHGARVTVTDLKGRRELAPSLRRLRGPVSLALGSHCVEDIHQSDMIVFNPDIPVRSPFVALAREAGKRIESEATLFYKLCTLPIAAVTGTRGKTTTTTWLAHLLKGSFKALTAGNSPANPLMKVLQKLEGLEQCSDSLVKPTIVVNELPSYHLEYFGFLSKGPDVAIITNISPDHLNRHASLEEYVDTKANIFLHQTESQSVIMNADNYWTEYLLRKPRRSRAWLFSRFPLLEDQSGLFHINGVAYFKDAVRGTCDAVLRLDDFDRTRGEHNLENLLASSLAAHLAGTNWKVIQRRIGGLPQIKYRQTLVFQSETLAVVNDNAATSPEGSIAALKRFGGSDCILITGGTDRELDYSEWAKEIRRSILPENLVFLEGSATKKMIRALDGFASRPVFHSTLGDCIVAARELAKAKSKALILFSPAAKSFEKFKNEFDRGRSFDRLLKQGHNHG